MNKTLSLIIFVLILIGAGWYYYGQNTKPASTTRESIKIASLLPLSGTTVTFYGEYIKRGIELAVEDVNNNGGINGQPLEVVYEDDQGQPRIGVQAASKLLSENYPVVIGDAVSGVTLSIAPLFEQHKVPLITAGSASPKITNAGDYIFRTKVSADLESNYSGALILNELKPVKVAFLYQNSDYGVGVFQPLEKAMTEGKVKIVGREKFEIGASDYRSQLTKIKSQTPNLVVVVGYPKEIGQILKQANELSVTAQFFSHSGSIGPDIVKVAGAAANGLLYLSETDPNPNDRITKNFLENYQSKYNESPELFSSLGYDTLNLVAAALRKCGRDSECIKNSFYSTNQSRGVTGPITFDKNGDIVRTKFTRMIIKDGKFVKVAE